jgi:ABC-type glycerol-3-phosphate transport system substrate-binding protein
MRALTKYLVHTALAATVGFAVAPLTAQAAYPDQPIKILIPFTPGGGTDFVSRMVGFKLSELTGWQVVLEKQRALLQQQAQLAHAQQQAQQTAAAAAASAAADQVCVCAISVGLVWVDSFASRALAI